ncbi:ATP-binding protein [uncultured Polaribacter sp.]|uniref:tetratricopeptide repeat-containing sensor histidine kinase n=1 Tax=uncultured Polaribacter sp. TaxID=174711 RepID=UPI0026352344|nr:ATP-binding protein [uncultured Polaribacter sp.]
MQKFYILLIFFSYNITFCQHKLDSILQLENKISNEKFLELVFSLNFEQAVLNPKKLLKLSKKATDIAVLIKNDSLIAKSYRLQSLAYHYTSSYELSIENTIKAAKIFENNNDIDNYAFSYIELGWRLKYIDIIKALEYMNKGILTLEVNNPKAKNLVEGYNNFGTLKLLNKEKDSALYFHNKSLKLAKSINDQIGIPFAYSNIANIYLKQSEYTNAKKYLDSAFHIRKKRKDFYGITDSYLYYGDLFYHKKEFQKAITDYKKALILSKNNNYFPLKKYALELLYKSYDSLNDYRNSLKYFKEFSKMKDSINNVSKINKINELQIKFDTSNKEKKIIEQQLTIKNRNLYAILLASALLILAIIFFSVYQRNELKKKQLQKEIDLKDALSKIKTQNRLQEQRLRISRDLHDNIGSQLTFIISSIDNLKYISKDANQKLKDKLSTISSFTGDTIHQLRDTIWAMNKSEITAEDLHARILSFIEKAKIATQNIEFLVDFNINKSETFTSLEGMNLFRVIQEAINNAIKYANASKIEINLNKKQNTFEICIIDNGIGFDIKTVNLGNGLSNIEKRISEINGKVQIISKKEKGTEIKILITSNFINNN